MNGGLGKQREDNDPQFITSAIEMEDARSQRASSLNTPASWRTFATTEGHKHHESYHAV